MDTAEFLAWDAPGNGRWQLVDGQPQAMAPASETHYIIQGELGALIRNHLVAMGRRCTLVPNAGIVPHVRSDSNVRIPDLAVTCVRSRQESQSTSDPVLLIEILSPSNRSETWTNVWAYHHTKRAGNPGAAQHRCQGRDAAAERGWQLARAAGGIGRRDAGIAEHRTSDFVGRGIC